MFAQLAVDGSDRDRIGESWNDVTSPNLRFTRLCRKNSQKIEFQPNEEVFANLAQCDIKIYSGSKKCLGL